MHLSYSLLSRNTVTDTKMAFLPEERKRHLCSVDLPYKLNLYKIQVKQTCNSGLDAAVTKKGAPVSFYTALW